VEDKVRGFCVKFIKIEKFCEYKGVTKSKKFLMLNFLYLSRRKKCLVGRKINLVKDRSDFQSVSTGDLLTFHKIVCFFLHKPICTKILSE